MTIIGLKLYSCCGALVLAFSVVTIPNYFQWSQGGAKKSKMSPVCHGRRRANGEGLRTIRGARGMTGSQMGRSFNISQPSVPQRSVNGLEQAEVNGSIRLKRPVGFSETSSPASPFLF